MTNQSSDTQPALRPFNVSVRGGRLTKFKGKVASIAPGLSVVATVAVLFTGSAAQAACTATDGVATCTADNFPGGLFDPYEHGIVYTETETEAEAVHTLTLPDHPEFTVLGRGVEVTYGGDQDVSVQMGRGTVETTGSDNHGVSANTTGTGNVVARLNGDGDITVDGDSSSGLRARIGNGDSTAEARAVMTAGEITIESGTYAEGVSAATMSRQGGDVTARMEGGEITTSGDQVGAAVHAYAHEATYVGTVRARMTGGVISTENTNADGQGGGYGVRASTRSISEHTEVIAQMEGGHITTNGSRAHAVTAETPDNVAKNSQANMTARMTGGKIETNDHNSSGVRAFSYGFGDATAEMSGDSEIIVRGDQSHGLQAFSVFHPCCVVDVDRAMVAGDVTARMLGGSITTNDSNSIGIHVLGGGGQAKALIEMSGDSQITTHADNAHGLYARIDSPDNDEEVRVEMTGGSIRTENNGGSLLGSHGIYVDTNGSGDLTVNMQGGTVTTVGRNSHGIWAESEGVGTLSDDDRGARAQAKAIVNLGADAVVTASGEGSDGIIVSGNVVDGVLLGARGFDIDVAGSVTGGAGNGAAIRTISSKTGTIDIASTAHVNAGSSGIAIQTHTHGFDGFVGQDDDGTATITSAGMISGDIHLDAGDDTLIVTGGSIIGDVHGGEGDNTLTLTGGSFTGHLDAGAGDDTVTISSAASFDFSHVLDGGTGDNDQLILSGRTMTSMENVINWEHLTLKDETKLSLDKGARLDMDLSIEAGSVFSASGGDRGTGATIAGQVANVPGGGLTITGDVTNSGTLSVQDGVAGDVITIEGNYTGSGTSTFALDARMDGTDTDTLHFMGDVTGETMLSIASVAGVESAPLEFDVVTVDGASDGATFTLMEGNHVMSDGEHAMISGAYLYRLAETDSGWALSALSEDDEISWQPASPLYDSYGAALLAFTAPCCRCATGAARRTSGAWPGTAEPALTRPVRTTGSPLWVQMGTEQITSSEENSTTGAALESGLWEMEMGADIVLNDSAAGLLVGGLMLSYATGSTDVSSDFGDGSIDTTGLGLGLSATWYDTRGFYVDGQVRLASYASDLSSDSLGTLTEGNSGTGLALSIEAGQRLDLGSRLTVIPQAQLSLSSVTFSDFMSERREGPQGEAQQEQVALSEATSQRLRLGLEFGEQDPGASGLYGMVNLYHEFGAGSEVEVDGASLTTEHEPWAVGVGLGGTYAWNDRVDLFGDVAYATGLSNAGDTSTLSASAGLKVTF